MEKTKFHDDLSSYINRFVHKTYDATQNFPKSELFGMTSQLRRASLSVALNYVEGYARQRKMVMKNFFEISYGSLKESQYLITFSYQRKMISEEEYQELTKLGNVIGAMIWGILKKL